MNELKEQLMERFLVLDHLILRYRLRAQPKGHVGMDPNKGQGRILAILKLQPTISQKELGYLLDISKQALAELISKLEKSGYITRQPSEKDRRSYVIQLTEAGRKVLPDEAHESLQDPALAIAFDRLNAEEMENLVMYMDKILGVLEENDEEDEELDAFAESFKARFAEMHGQGFFGRPMGFRRGGFGRGPEGREMPEGFNRGGKRPEGFGPDTREMPEGFSRSGKRPEGFGGWPWGRNKNEDSEGE